MLSNPIFLENLTPFFIYFQLICKFCKNNREDESVYTTHTLMSAEGKIVCPILYAYECKVCKATGDYAHTLKYCPMLRTAIGPGKVRTPVLPLQATFPQHLSANARQAMGTTTRPNNQGGFDKLADLRSAAQTILSFTDQIMSQPGSSSSSAPPTPSTGFPANIPDYLAEMQQKQQAAELQKQLEHQIKQLTQKPVMQQQQHGPISPMTPQQQQQLPAAFQQMFQRQIQQQYQRQQQQHQSTEDPSTELLKLLGIHKADDNNTQQQQGGVIMKQGGMGQFMKEQQGMGQFMKEQQGMGQFMKEQQGMGQIMKEQQQAMLIMQKEQHQAMMMRNAEQQGIQMMRNVVDDDDDDSEEDILASLRELESFKNVG